MHLESVSIPAQTLTGSVEHGTVKLSRRGKGILVATALIAALTAIAGWPAYHLLRTAWRDREGRAPVPHGYADDASRLNLTPIALTWDIPSDVPEPVLPDVRQVTRRPAATPQVRQVSAKHP